MPQMYEVFIKGKRILFTEKEQNEHLKYNSLELNNLVDKFLKSGDQMLEIKCFNLYETWCVFKKNYKYIKAAGGLVFNERNEFLVIERLGVWDLPKGKIELQERKKEAAIREVEEETGIQIESLDSKLTSTYHIYDCPYQKRAVLKRTFWYKMSAHSKQKLKPQLEEDITHVFWLPWKERSKFISQTYPTLSSLLQEEID